MEIRTIQPGDRAALFDFLRRQYPDCPLKADERWFDWRFGGSPLGTSWDTYYLAWHDGHIVGQLASLRDRVRTGRTWHDARWLVDLIVDPQSRGDLVPLQLFRAAMKCPELLLTTGAGPHLVRLYDALGWRRLRIAETLYCPIRPARLLAMAESAGRSSTTGRLARRAFWLADRGWPLAQRRAGGGRSADKLGLSIASIDRFDGDFDELLGRCPPELQTTTFRSSDYLNWKFTDRPCGARFTLTARDLDSRRLRAYLVGKPMHRPGIARWIDVADYVVDDQLHGTFGALTAAVLRKARELDVDFIRWRLSNPRHISGLKRPFWWQRTLPVSDEVFAYATDAALLDQLQGADWHLTSIVSDRVDHGRDEWEE